MSIFTKILQICILGLKRPEMKKKKSTVNNLNKQASWRIQNPFKRLFCSFNCLKIIVPFKVWNASTWTRCEASTADDLPHKTPSRPGSAGLNPSIEKRRQLLQSGPLHQTEQFLNIWLLFSFQTSSACSFKILKKILKTLNAHLPNILEIYLKHEVI